MKYNTDREKGLLLFVYLAAIALLLSTIGCRTVNKTASKSDSTSVSKSETVTVIKRDTLTVDNSTIEFVFQTDTVYRDGKRDTVWLFKDMVISSRPLKSIKQTESNIQSGSRTDSNSIASSDSTKVVKSETTKQVKSAPAWLGLVLIVVGIFALILFIGEGNLFGWLIDKIAKLITKTK